MTWRLVLAPRIHRVARSTSPRRGAATRQHVAERLEPRILLNAGDLDPTFGDDGKVFLGNASAGAQDVMIATAVQRDGKILLAGPGFGIERLNADGSVDESFGNHGGVATTFLHFASATSILVQPDGKIVLGGSDGVDSSTGSGVLNGGQYEFALARYNPDGSPDTSFGSGGKVLTQLPGSEGVQSISLAPDGKILAAGLGKYQDPAHPADPNYSSRVLYVARYLQDGSLDASFGGTGYVYREAAGDLSTSAVAVQGDGKVLAGAEFKADPTVWRFNADGSLDTSFGLGGMTSTPLFYGSSGPGNYAIAAVSRMLVEPDGKIVTAAPEFNEESCDVGVVLSRYNPGGSLDAGFPIELLAGGLGAYSAAGLLLQSDGKFIVGGAATTAISGFNPGITYYLNRYLPSGAPDPSFHFANINGVTIDALAMAPDGKLVVAGGSVARLLNDGLPAGGGATPYLGHPFNALTDTIEAENFDEGGEGISYHDTTPQNLGGQYRSTGVDINSGGSNGYSVGYTAPGEWLDYTIFVPISGNYRLTAQVASSGQGGTFHLEIGGAVATGEMAVPDTGGWFAWQTISSSPVTLTAGTHVMRIAMDQGGYWGTIGNFDYFRLSFVSITPATQPGSFDPTFAFHGRDLLSEPEPVFFADSVEHHVKATAVQSDGKILLAGSAGTVASNGIGQFWLERLNPDGSVDNSFGNGGSVQTAIGPISFATSILILPDGKLLLGGSTEDSATATMNADFALVRYNADGSLDSTFGKGGSLVTDFAGNEEVDSLALVPDGKIVAAGSYFLYPNVGFDIARYNADGSLDTSFNGTGMLAYDLGETGSNPGPAAVLVDPAGKIVVGEHSGNQPAVYRFNADGAIDLSFGSKGIAVENASGAFSALALQPDGKILAAGSKTAPIPPGQVVVYLLARFDVDGKPDARFGSGGIVQVSRAPGPAAFPHGYPVAGIAVQPDGRILLVGSQIQLLDQFTDGSQVLIRRFLSDGSPDPGFRNDNDPQFMPPPPYRGTLAEAMSLAPNGKLVVAADVWADASADSPHWLGVMRYETGVSPPLGDLNQDASVGFDDLVTLARHYGKAGAAYSDGDLTGDGVVNFADLVILARNYGHSPSTAEAALSASLDIKRRRLL